MTDIARPARRTVMCASALLGSSALLTACGNGESVAPNPTPGQVPQPAGEAQTVLPLTRSSREGAGTGCCQRPSYRRRDWRIALPQRRKNRAGLFEYLHPPRMCSDPEVFQKRFLLCLPRFSASAPRTVRRPLGQQSRPCPGTLAKSKVRTSSYIWARPKPRPGINTSRSSVFRLRLCHT